ncbi:MAG: hypothetical protein Kow00129_09490 [Thermoleophilia bacterium]
MPNTRAVALLSGGLDSRLAAKMVLEQGIELYGVNFVTPFCTCTAQGCRSEARSAAADLGIPLKVLNNSEPLLEAVKAPRFGFGRGANPCLDCRVISFTRAAGYLEEIGGSFLVTGEVLGQRPMSQRREAIELIERETGLAGRILRPLSAHHFPPTLPERQGLVDRAQLLALAGRSRRPQMRLAEDLGVNDYPCPAGGCLLTDPTFGRRLKELLVRFPDPQMPQVTLLKAGRHFLTSEGDWLIIPREELEDRRLRNLRHALSVTARGVGFEGPTAGFLTAGPPGPRSLQEAADLVARYGKGREQTVVPVELHIENGRENVGPAAGHASLPPRLSGSPARGRELAEILPRL